jgi:hypothetical protein
MTEGLSGTEVLERVENLFFDGGLASKNSFSL